MRRIANSVHKMKNGISEIVEEQPYSITEDNNNISTRDTQILTRPSLPLLLLLLSLQQQFNHPKRQIRGQQGEKEMEGETTKAEPSFCPSCLGGRPVSQSVDEPTARAEKGKNRGSKVGVDGGGGGGGGGSDGSGSNDGGDDGWSSWRVDDNVLEQGGESANYRPAGNTFPTQQPTPPLPSSTL
jgi:hypothetical protein